MKSVFIICLTSFALLTGCATTKVKVDWSVPPHPESKSVDVIPVKEAEIKGNGFYLSREHAMNLADNVDELKAYNEKLEVLINKMKKYYGAK